MSGSPAVDFPPLDLRPASLGFMAEEAIEGPEPAAARALIIPFPLEASVTFGTGTAGGPEAIINASAALESYDGERKRDLMRDFGVATLETPQIAETLAGALDQIAMLTGQALDHGMLPLVLGGEHSLTVGAMRPFAARFDDLVVLQFDAHADLRQSYRGERLSHACAMARVLDHSNVNLVQVGLRSLLGEEARFIGDNGTRVFPHWAHARADWDLQEIVAPLAGKPIYVSFDVDCFDAGLMPATGTPEPGGLSFDEACGILRAAGEAGQIVGADVVEFAPIAGMAACDVTAAKIAYKILGYGLAGN